MEDLDWLARELGRRIRQAREAAIPRLTQDALAQGAGLARTSITNIETGNQQPTLQALWRIADALRVSPCELLPPWPGEQQAVRTNGSLPSDIPQGTRAFLQRLDQQTMASRRRA